MPSWQDVGMLRASLGLLICLSTVAYLVAGQILWSRRRFSLATLAPYIRENWVEEVEAWVHRH